MTTSENQLTEEGPEDFRELEELVDEGEPPDPNNSRRSFFWLQAIAFLLGLGLLVYVINRVGLQPIFDALLRIGFFGFLILLAISGSRHVFRTIAMSAAVPREHRGFNFFQAFAARLGGEAISFLTFTGPLLGEATKVALLRKRVPLTYGVPALVVDNLLYNLSVVFFIFLLTDCNCGECGVGHRGSRSGGKATHHAGHLGARSNGPAAVKPKSDPQAAPAHLPHRIEGLRLLQTSSRRFLWHDRL